MDGAHYIAQVLRNSSIVQKLDLWCNSIGGSGLQSIADALITNSSLVELRLRRCSVEITEENGPVLREMLQRNGSLEILNLSLNQKVSDTGTFFIAQGLKQNSSLRVLDLLYCGISDEGVESLGEALVENHSLKKLRLGANNDISERGLSVLTECLKANRGLVELTLPGYYGYISAETQKTVNAVRRRNGTPLITVHFLNYLDQMWCSVTVVSCKHFISGKTVFCLY